MPNTVRRAPNGRFVAREEYGRQFRVGQRVVLATPHTLRGVQYGAIEAEVGQSGVIREVYSQAGDGDYACWIRWDYPTGCSSSQVDVGCLGHHDGPAIRPTCRLCHNEYTGRFCTLCYVRCYACGEQALRTDAFEDETFLFHDSCTGCCDECGGTHGTSFLYQVEGLSGSYCSDCISYCQSCGANTPRGQNYCHRHLSDGHVHRVRSYGHTHPQNWLGSADYYLGFELEITAPERTYSDTTPIFEWASEHLGFGDALDCKSDSSVHGFEIATQPMSPDFFESVDWESFMDMLNQHYPPSDISARSKEPTSHGLHVHIGRVAFENDPFAVAAFCFLLGQGDHLETIGRRRAHSYCRKVDKPASAAIVEHHQNRGSGRNEQYRRLYHTEGVTYGRDAINLTNSRTIEVRAFRSTRDPEHLRSAFRLVYLAAEYIRSMRGESGFFGKKPVAPKDLLWKSFLAWVQDNHPDKVSALADPVE